MKAIKVTLIFDEPNGFDFIGKITKLEGVLDTKIENTNYVTQAELMTRRGR